MGKDPHIRPCLGCGYCCKKAPCSMAAFYFDAKEHCPVLVWDTKAQRYWCDAARRQDEIGENFRKFMAIGEGCCCPLNSDRHDIKPPH